MTHRDIDFEGLGGSLCGVQSLRDAEMAHRDSDFGDNQCSPTFVLT